jgi:hypothetical protein
MTDFATKGKITLNTEAMVWREVGDELLVLEVGTAAYLTINGTARMLWLQLEDGCEWNELVHSLVARFRVRREDAERDIATFLTDLETRSLLRYIG